MQKKCKLLKLQQKMRALVAFSGNPEYFSFFRNLFPKGLVSCFGNEGDVMAHPGFTLV